MLPKELIRAIPAARVALERKAGGNCQNIGRAALAPTSAWLVMTGLVIAGMGASAALPMFWQLPPAFLSSATLAAGIALISSFGSIAAFLAPYLIGWMRDTTQSASLALYLLAILIALGAGLVLRTPAAVVNPR